jgi:hypothetical protein
LSDGEVVVAAGTPKISVEAVRRELFVWNNECRAGEAVGAVRAHEDEFVVAFGMLAPAGLLFGVADDPAKFPDRL